MNAAIFSTFPYCEYGMTAEPNIRNSAFRIPHFTFTMDEHLPDLELEAELSHLVLIVVGAHLRAEEADRPLAQWMEHRVGQWIKQHGDTLNVPMTPRICTDVLYLNNPALHRRPAISIGGPGVNALSAVFAQQLPQARPDEQQIVIQIDPEFTDLRVCIWGTDHKLTQRGLEIFVDRYLDGFLRAAATQVIPEEG